MSTIELPREVAASLERAIKVGMKKEDIVAAAYRKSFNDVYDVLNKYPAYEICKALEEGYVTERTPEEKLRAEWRKCIRSGSRSDFMRGKQVTLEEVAKIFNVDLRK